MIRSVITGTGRSLPERRLTNAELEKMVDTTDEWIVARTGIRERRIAAPDEFLSKFATEAGRQALEGAGVPAEKVGLLICATVTPDMPIPAAACFVAHNLGLTNAYAFDMQAGCSGFLYALSVADAFIASGRAEHVLVVGGEILSKYVDWTDRGTCILFADGAGAVLLSAKEGEKGILGVVCRTDGSQSDFITMPGGGSRNPPNIKENIDARLPFIKMKGNETFKIAVRSLTEVSEQVLRDQGFTAADVDVFIPHQANTRIIEAVGSRLGIGADRTIVNIARYGNTSAASIPIALDECVREGRIQPGNLILMSAFGAGLTWAGALVRW
jgi:3-oxoacyl-[acyl-carrier-protein] synthase-3